MMLVGFIGIWFSLQARCSPSDRGKTLYETVSNYPFTIIPLFVLMGGFADNAGITRIYETFDKWFRRLPGGLGIATIVAIAGFSAISGSSVATSAAIAKTVIPEMRRYNYAPKFAGGVVAAGGNNRFSYPTKHWVCGFRDANGAVYWKASYCRNATRTSPCCIVIGSLLPGKNGPSAAPVPPGRAHGRKRSLP